MLAHKHKRRLGFLRRGCVAEVPCLTLPTCRIAFSRSICSQRRSTSSEARDRAGRSTGPWWSRGSPSGCPWRSQSAARPHARSDAHGTDRRRWVSAPAKQLCVFTLAGPATFRCPNDRHFLPCLCKSVLGSVWPGQRAFGSGWAAGMRALCDLDRRNGVRGSVCGYVRDGSGKR
jgi:hypothetical protein